MTEYFYVAKAFGLGQVFLCSDIIFYVTTNYSQMERFCVAIGNFMLQRSWLGWEDFLPRQGTFMSRQN